MGANDWGAAKQLFGEALELDPGLRAEFLDRRCAGDPELRRMVERLLASHSSEFMAEPTVATPLSAVADGPASQAPGERIGDRIGPYTLRRLIGTGGFGVVYEP